MQGILSPYLWLFALVYIDNIVVYSKTYKEHICQDKPWVNLALAGQ
jgi:lysozyme family protein